MKNHSSSLLAAGTGDGSNHHNHQHHYHRHTTNNNDDLPIIATAHNALLAKHATMQAGYYVDPFMEHFRHCGRHHGRRGGGGVSGGVSGGGVSDDSRGDHVDDDGDDDNVRRGLGHGRGHRRPMIQPLIKRGTHARVCVMDRAVGAFLKEHSSIHNDDDDDDDAAAAAAACQIVVLGAGFDTTFFRFRNGNIMEVQQQQQQQQQEQQQGGGTNDDAAPPQTPFLLLPPPHVHWFEVDHDTVVQEKANLIQSSNLLSTFCPGLQKTEHGFHSGRSCRSHQQQQQQQQQQQGSSSSFDYHLIGHDLRESPQMLLDAKLQLDPTLPTLFLMECVSMYLPQTSFQSLLQALNQAAHRVTLVCYEAILGSPNEDPFGRMMEQNLIRARVALPGSCLLQTRTLQDRLDQMVVSTTQGGSDGGGASSFQRAVGCDMWSAYETVLTADQRKRANQSEFLDEYEEWVLIMQHYCFVAAQGGRQLLSSSSSSHPLPSLTARSSEMGLTRVGNDSPLGFRKGKCLEKEVTVSY